MGNILYINANIRENSRTRILAETVLKSFGGDVTEVCIAGSDIKPLNADTLALRDRLISEGDYSHDIFKYARAFAKADEIVLSAPYWDLSFPSVVKIYFELVTVLGLTFTYTPQGIPKGLCRAKRLIYVTTAGGPVMEYNMGYDYVKALAGLYYGIPEVICFKAENLDVYGADVESIINKTIEEIKAAL